MQNIELRYELGTLVISECDAQEIPKFFNFDSRTLNYRAPACRYRDAVLEFLDKKITFTDKARDYEKLQLKLTKTHSLREHQKQALDAWLAAQGQGVVVLPTGAGKTYLALLAIEKAMRPTLIMVPTIDLLQQWHSQLSHFFGCQVGMLGGGSKEISAITVSTYDSAHLMIESLGNKFGMIVFDECHHLAAPQYQMIAQSSIAPFRLGLTATIERQDGGESIIYDLLGPKIYEASIQSMVKKVLAPYDVMTIAVPLSAEERQIYQTARAKYLDFVKRHHINVSQPANWLEFVRKSTYLPGGRIAMKAYYEQKKIAQASEQKLAVIWQLLKKHKHDRSLIFTDDNELAYRIGETFILPVLTHQTKAKERQRFLADFKEGKVKVLVTSKVLNEGVDVPEASVGIIVSGSSTVREHVQRLGRILRHQPDKRATLYELVSQNTNETYVSRRRREHHAYQKSFEL